jgi:hypothetical protein
MPLPEPTQQQIDAAQIMSLRTAGFLASEIADALGLPLGRVQIHLRSQPRRFQRGCGPGTEPSFLSRRGAF